MTKKEEYLFRLDLSNKSHLENGKVKEIRKAFADEGIYPSNLAKICKIDDKHWEMHDGAKCYKIKETENKLKVYEKKKDKEDSGESKNLVKLKFGNLDVGEPYKGVFDLTRSRIEKLENELDNLRDRYKYEDPAKLIEKLKKIKEEMFEDYLNKNKDILKRIKKEHLDWEIKLLKGKISRSQEVLEIDNAITELEEMKNEIEKDIKSFCGEENAPGRITSTKKRIEDSIKKLRKKRASIIEDQINEIDEIFSD